MTNPIPNFIPVVPPPSDEDVNAPVVEEEGETVLDPDADPSRIDSAEADRIASGADEE
ncbi:hypothetical protein GCM10010910_10350 [Microbacterium nanhaiense]|uniref:Uncharacterized protein n=1 Tax=Microbacterium nanhaiense TaxID=1301026 RepID=A0ABQ2N0Y3_9MICO|nr:hypothetical protein [Microbacterium nanhaiense]GGO61766.1 hypothetical protein GCM10010910_10350 [Microbacterium nanhaiense]